MAAILNSGIMDSAMLHNTLTPTNSIWIQTHSFWLNLMMAAIMNSANLDSIIYSQKNFTHAFSLNLMMAVILNSGHVGFSHFAQIVLHLIILTQLDDGSHLEFCQLEFQDLGFSNILHKRKLHSFILTQLDDASHLEFWKLRIPAILDSANTSVNHSWLNLMMAAILTLCQDSIPSHFAQNRTSLIHSDSTWWWQPSWILPCWIQTLPSWIQTPCYLLSESLQKHSHTTLTLTQTNSIWLKLIHSHLILMMAAILNSGHVGFSHLAVNNTSLNHSDSTGWWQPSWICKLRFSQLLHKQELHSFILTSNWWWQPSWILPHWNQTLPSYIQTPCHLLSDSLKNTLTPIWLWLWLKLIQYDSNSFILTQLDDSSHLEFCHLQYSHFAQIILHLIILTQLDDGSHLESAILDSAILHKKELHSFILTELDDGNHLEFFHLEFCHLGFSYIAQNSDIN